MRGVDEIRISDAAFGVPRPVTGSHPFVAGYPGTLGRIALVVVRMRGVGYEACYLTSESILNIGKYIAITMTPTISPTRIIINGSTIDVSDWIAASTSSS